ncbi:MAG: metallophosphoesterase [Woeseiaceae bacterium]
MRYPRVLFLVLFLGVCWLPAQADQWHFSNVDRIVAIGDVHGAFDALTKTLQAAEVLDDELAWSGGKAHLVFTGDLLDRGARSREVMDLILRLEREARRSGGRVHVLLGNHEVMNLIGDLRYVAKAEYAAYQDIESSRERERWFKYYLAGQPAGDDDSAAPDLEVMRARFNALAPPGYFGHRKAFRHNGKYGRWLLKKPFIVVINDTAFVHGGLPSFISEYGLDGVNVSLKNDLHQFVLGRDKLVDQQVLSPVQTFKKIPALLREKNEAGAIPRRSQDTVQAVIELSQSPLNTPIGPIWYRGTATCSMLVEGEVLAGALATIDASRVVMGHTSTVTRRVQQRANGRTVEIDTGMLAKVYEGTGNALVIEGDRLTVVNQDGRTGLLPVNHPVRVGHESIPLGDDELETLLANGDLVEGPIDGEARRLVEVRYRGLNVFARFGDSEVDGSSPEIAAYRLDRMLGLGMVPVTVRRAVGGRSGILQLLPASRVSDAELVGIKDRLGAPCSLDKQAATMRVFDALIGNAGRTPTAMLYDTEDLLLILVDHRDAFRAGATWPGHSSSADFSVSDEWRAALLKLDDESLRAELDDVLSARQLAGLMQRRDALLGKATADAAH